MQKYFFAILAICQLMTPAFASEKVVLQLTWEHEFQFAGYYAAKWQGFYHDVGLDVEIKPVTREDGTFVSPVDEIKNGNADFSVSALDILLAKDKEIDLVVLASIFQRSQTGVFSLADTPLENLSALAKLRIAGSPVRAGQIEIKALFKSRGFDLSKIEFVDLPPTVETLIKHKADAIITYGISANIQAREEGIKLNKLIPRDHGLKFYGDTLFTSQKLVQRRPELVADFIAASKKGWLYALQNKQKIAKRISEELPRHVIHYQNPYAYNLAFAEITNALMDYPQKEIGEVNQERWITMNEQMRSIGAMQSQLNTNKFFFQPPAHQKDLAANIWFLLLFFTLLGLTLFFWYKQKITITLVSMLLIIYVIGYQVEEILNNELLQNSKLNTLRQLNSVSAKLEGHLRTNLSYLTGFAAYISVNPDLNADNFKSYAQEIFKKEPMLLNFAAAKDLVINYVYPLKGNEKLVGVDYRKNDAQKEMVLQVASTGQLLVVGPVNLVQDGSAFIGRAPVFIGDDVNRRLWGIISAPIDADSLFLHSDIKELNLAIQNYDSLGNAGPVFLGDSAIFDDPEHLESNIHIGGGTWRLGATAPEAADNVATNVIIFRVILLIASIFVCSFAVFRIKQIKQKFALQKTLLINQELLENVGQVAKIGGWKLDRNLHFIQWSKQASILLGQPPEFRPDSLAQIAYLFDKKEFALWKLHIEKVLTSANPFDLELKLLTADNTDVWLRVIVNILAEGLENTVTGTMQDVTEQVLSAKTIAYQAKYDALTNLPNRALFNDRLRNTLDNPTRKNKMSAVIFIDLDRFKAINDNHGHQTGDNLLVLVSARIIACVRYYDTISRLSGDEFAVILTEINDPATAARVSNKIYDAMQQPYIIEGKSLFCTASIGIALSPDDSKDAQSLIQKADQAMYEVKASGRNGCQFYTKAMQEKYEHRSNLSNELIIAVAENKITPYYQPIFDLKTNRISKCEALARWERDDGSFVSPLEFIVLAEETGLINKLDLSMLENSSRAIRSIKQEISNISLTINISPRLFHTKDKALENWLKSIYIISQKIDVTVEITERLLTCDSGEVLRVLNRLKEYGVKIAIDDFGTGYSSLIYLVKFPVDIIKIDGSFIDAIGRGNSAETMIEIILLMAQKLNIQVVAEGIETQLQLDFLRRHHCDFGQGYFLARPMPENKFKSFVKAHLVQKAELRLA